MAGSRLRVLLCSNGGLNGAIVLDRLLACERVELAGLIISSRVLGPRQGFLGGVAGHIGRSGVAYATYLGCCTLLADFLLGLSKTGSMAGRANKRGIPIFETPRINDPEGVAFVARVAPDLIVSAYFNQVIAADVARLPRLGAVNIHPGALPDFGGVDPVFFALLRGAPALGVAVHRITPELDKGDILAQATSAPRAGESVLRANARLYDLGAGLLTGILDDLEARSPGKAQGREGAYDSWPGKAQVADLRRKGVRLARWSDLRDASRIVESARTAAR